MTPETVEEFNGERVGSILRQMGYKFTVDEDGDYRASFGTKGDDSFVVYFRTSGQREEMLAIVSPLKVPIEADAYPRAMEICNRWNQSYCWPTAHLHTESRQGMIVAESFIPLADGIHDAALRSFVQFGINTVAQFDEWMRAELAEITAAPVLTDDQIADLHRLFGEEAA